MELNAISWDPAANLSLEMYYCVTPVQVVEEERITGIDNS